MLSPPESPSWLFRILAWFSSHLCLLLLTFTCQCFYLLDLWFFIDPHVARASLVAQPGKHLPAMQETWVQSLAQEDPLEKEWQHTPVLLPRKAHGWRSLLGYSPWGRKELDTTERLHSLHVGKHSLCPGEPQNLVSNLDLVSSEFQIPVSSSLLDSSICQTSWASQAQHVKNLTPSLALPPTQVYPHSNIF